MFSKSSKIMIGTLVVGLAACSPAAMTPVDDSPAGVTPSAPVVNQATVYASHLVAFDKGSGGGSGSGGSGGSDGSGTSGGSGSGSSGGPSCTMPDSLVLDVGPNGGSFSTNGNSFVVPKNAVSTTVHIVMVPDIDSTVAVHFYPEGLVFNANAQPTLTLNTQCIGSPANASIVYTDDAGSTILEYKQTKGKTANSITTTIAHFSRYAVAW